MMAPVREHYKVSKPFVWTERANKVFEKIKKYVASPSIISFPDFTHENVKPSSCKKMKRDTYFQPNGTEVVYH